MEYQIFDGVVGLTQCAIGPGESFLYDWPVYENPGTYWWHGHAGIPIVGQDFARGMLIVHPEGSGRADLENYEEEMSERLIMYEDMSPTFPFMDYIMMLGGISARPEKDLEGFYESMITWTHGLANGELNHEVFVEAGKTYRFRLLNGGHVFAYIWSIDNHDFKVVASDAAEVVPYPTDGLQIHVGERFDVEITFQESEENKSYYMRAMTPSYDISRGIFSAIRVRGSKAKESDPYPEPPTAFYTQPKQVLNCLMHQAFANIINCQPITNLRPAELLEMPDLDDIKYHIVDFDDESSPLASHFVALDNGVFKQSVMPTKAMIRSDFKEEVDMHPNTNVLRLNLHKTVIMVFRSATAFPHPIHLHGHKFEVLKIVPRKYPDCPNGRCVWQNIATSFSPKLSDIAKQPKSVVKDTVILPAGGLIAIRFVTDNPGVWAIHCHLDQHLEDGQFIIMDEGGYRQSHFPDDYPSCNYTGRIPMPKFCRTDTYLVDLYMFGFPVKSYYQCSEPHLCGRTQYTEEDISIFEKIKAMNLKERNSFRDFMETRFRPEETETWGNILDTIIDVGPRFTGTPREVVTLKFFILFPENIIWEPTETSNQPNRTHYLCHVTFYQPIMDQYFLIRSVPATIHTCLIGTKRQLKGERVH
eukprot:sb/3462895/